MITFFILMTDYREAYLHAFLFAIALLSFVGGIVFLIEKRFPSLFEIRQPASPCQHENVEQWWYAQQILQRKCLDCGKEELNRNNGFQKLWNPKFINGEPIRGIDLEKMQGHKRWLEEKKLKHANN